MLSRRLLHGPYCLTVLATLLAFLTPQAPAQGQVNPFPRRGFFSGDIIVTSEVTPGALRVFSPSGTLKVVFDHPDWSISGAGRYVALSRDGHVWVSDINRYPGAGDHLSGELYEFDPAGKFLRSVPVQLPCIDPAGAGIRGFTFGPEGTIFVVGGWLSGSINLLMEIEPERGETIHCYSLGAYEPVDVKVGADGFLYVSVLSAGLPQGTLLQIDRHHGTVANALSCPLVGGGLAEIKTLSSNKVLVANSTAGAPGSFLLFDPNNSGACPTSIPFPGPGPYGFDLWAGRIFAGTIGGVIYVIDASTGQVQNSFQINGVISSIAVIP